LNYSGGKYVYPVDNNARQRIFIIAPHVPREGYWGPPLRRVGLRSG
jgi:hypothetical protein